jgi:hypothetical protein
VKDNVENALYHCGRERVFHRDGPIPAIAIRWDGPPRIVAPDGTQAYLVSKGETLDDAGEQAATRFAEAIRSEAKRLTEWADTIESALRGRP